MRIKTTIKTITLKQIDAEALWRVIGAKVKVLREKKNITQVDLSQRLGWSRTSTTNLETGRQHTPLEALYNIALVFDVDITELLP